MELVGVADALDPALQTWQVGQTQSDQGFSVTLQQVEFGRDTTRAYVTLQNGTGVPASFYAFNARIVQGATQIDPTTSYEYTELEPQSDLSAGVQSEGIVIFGPSDPNQPLELQFEWYSEDYSAGVQSEGIVIFGPSDPNQPLELQFEWYSEDYNITANPIVFQITP